MRDIIFMNYIIIQKGDLLVKKCKGFHLMLVMLLAVLVLAACGQDSGSGSDSNSSSDDKGKIKVGLSVSDLTLERWQHDRDDPAPDPVLFVLDFILLGNRFDTRFHRSSFPAFSAASLPDISRQKRL